MKSMTFIFSTLCALAMTASMAHARAASGAINDMALFQKLESLFNASSTPYPVESSAIKSVNEVSSYVSCSMVDYTGATSNQTPLFFVKYQVTTKEANGPLSPAVVKYGYATQATSMKSVGSHFTNGVLNIDGLPTANRAVANCKDGTTLKQYVSSARSHLAADGTSYEINEKCNDDSMKVTRNFKLASNYLIQKINLKSNNVTGDAYEYCWK